jgi:hypothetical protein
MALQAQKVVAKCQFAHFGTWDTFLKSWHLTKCQNNGKRPPSAKSMFIFVAKCQNGIKCQINISPKCQNGIKERVERVEREMNFFN